MSGAQVSTDQVMTGLVVVVAVQGELVDHLPRCPTGEVLVDRAFRQTSPAQTCATPLAEAQVWGVHLEQALVLRVAA
jgi:hypothetical protein